MPRGYLNGYPATAGGKAIVVGTMTGPTSYANPAGVLFTDSAARSIDYLQGSVSLSGTYFVDAKPNTLGSSQKWYFRWSVMATGAEVANATNLSAEKFNFFAVYS